MSHMLHPVECFQGHHLSTHQMLTAARLFQVSIVQHVAIRLTHLLSTELSSVGTEQQDS